MSDENMIGRGVLAEILRTGRTLLPSGERIEVDSAVDGACGRLLQEMIMQVRPTIALEVGLAYGISTLYILEALESTGGGVLVGMDPAQHDLHWRSGGLNNIKRAGYDNLFNFHEETSQQVLPALVDKKVRIQFAFIDGWHTFDHALVDFFYIDKMLDVGGVVIFDDVGYPSIRRVCEFVLSNRNYQIAGCVRSHKKRNPRVVMKRHLTTLLAPLVRTDVTPSSEVRRIQLSLENVYFLALSKRSEDDRRWDHFVRF